MHSGPDYFYTKINNPYLFGIHLSSYKYSFPPLKHFQQTGAKTIAAAGRESSAFFNTTCDEGLKYATKILGLKSVMNRITYDPAKKSDKKYIENIAKTICDSKADVYLLCIHHEEAKIMIDKWRAMGICQPKGLWMTCAAWSADLIISSDNYNYAFGAGQWHKSMPYGDEFFENGQKIIHFIKEKYGISTNYNAVAGYVVPYAISKLVRRIFQNIDLGDQNINDIEEKYLSRKSGGEDQYEFARRQLETLTIPTSVYGPITFDENRRNNGRLPSASQILPPPPAT